MGRRRALLLGGGLALGSIVALSGCTVGSTSEPLPPVHEPTPGVDPDVVLAGKTLNAEQAMLDRVNATMTRHTGLRALLSPVAAVHEAHVKLLIHAVPGSGPSPGASPSPSPSRSPSPTPSGTTAAAGATASGSPSPSASPSASPSVSPSVSPSSEPVPRDPRRAVHRLARHEDELSLFDKQQAFSARSGAFARLLASMAAAAAQQAVTLGHTAHHRAGAR